MKKKLDDDKVTIKNIPGENHSMFFNDFISHEKNYLNVNLNKDINSIVNSVISTYRLAKARGEKIKKPEFNIGNTTWQFDKIESNRMLISKEDEKSVIEIKIKTGDILQIDNKEIYDNNLKPNDFEQINYKNASERSEIQDKAKFDLGVPYKWNFAFKIPEDFPAIDNRLVVGQRKQTGKTGVNQNPLIAQRIRDGKFFITMNNSGDPQGKNPNATIYSIDMSELLGKWIDMEYDVKFSEKSDGYLNIKMNGKEIVNYSGPLASSSNSENKEHYENNLYFKFGLYRDNYQYAIKQLQSKEGDKSEKILGIQKAIEQEKEGNPMTILFRNYHVEKVS